MNNLSKRFNTLVLLTLTGLVAFGGLLALVPSSAQAVPDPGTPTGPSTGPDGLFYDLPVSDQGVAWTSYKAATTQCTLSSGFLEQSQITSGEWFASSTVQIGHHVEPDDGKASCKDEKNWFTNLLNAAGYAGNFLAPANLVFEKNDNGLFTVRPDGAAELKRLLDVKLFGNNAPSTAPNYVAYGILMANFTSPTACGAKPLDNVNAGSAYRATKEIMVYDPATKTAVKKLYGYAPNSGDVDNTDMISVGPGLPVGGADDFEIACDTIANNLANTQFASSVEGCVAMNTCAGVESASTGTPGEDPNLQCGTMWNPLNWYLCPMVKGITSVVNALDNGINRLLKVNADEIFNRCGAPGSDAGSCQTSADGYYAAWENFRAIALGLLIVAALFMVIAQALGFEALDAYTIKKIIPRLIVAIIGIALSWEIMRFMVDFTNGLGTGIRSLIYYPFKDIPSTMELGGGATVAVTFIAGAAVAGLGIIGLLSFAATALIAVAIAFLVLIVRQLIIIVLILLAPIAIACYILPNTNGIWKIWNDSFVKLLLMFPIIVAFLAVGRVFAMISTSDAGASGAGPISELIGFAAYFLPYFLIPLTFRFAGGAMRTLGGFVNDKGRGGFDRLKKFRQGQYQEHGGRHVADASTRVLQKRADYAQRLQAKGSVAAAKGTKRGNLQRIGYNMAAGNVGGYNIEARMSNQRAQTSKEMNEQINAGQDEEIRGLTVNKEWANKQGDMAMGEDGLMSNGYVRIGANGQKEYKTLAGNAWVSESKVDAGRKRWGDDTFAQQTALSYEMRKAASEEEVEHIGKHYKNVAQGAGSWKMSDYEAGGAWIGAAFENQNSHLELKKTNWEDGTMSAKQQSGFVDEIYQKKGSYPLAQMGSSTIARLADSYQDARTNETTALAARAAAQNDVMVHRRSGDQEAEQRAAQKVREHNLAAQQAVQTQQKVQAVAETFMSRYGAGGMPGDPENPATIIEAQQQQQAQQAGNIPSQRTPRQGNYQTNAPGAAAVNERVRELAVLTGVYRAELPAQPTDSDNPIAGPGGPTGPAAPQPRIPRQN